MGLIAAIPIPKSTKPQKSNKNHLTPEQKTANQAKRLDRHRSKKSMAIEHLKQKVDACGDDALLDEYEAGAYLNISVQSLRNWRINCGPLPYFKIGASVRYRLGDIKTLFHPYKS